MTLVELFENKIYSTDKQDHNYLQYYDEWFKQYKDKKISLLEIGLENGHSIKLWKDYFTKASIYGMDINDGGYFKGDSTDTNQLLRQGLLRLKFDIIIDDGDHHPTSQAKTYMNMKDQLNSGGLYIIEDIAGPKYNNYIYEKGVDKIKSLGFELIDTDGKHSISYLGVLKKQ